MKKFLVAGICGFVFGSISVTPLLPGITDLTNRWLHGTSEDFVLKTVPCPQPDQDLYRSADRIFGTPKTKVEYLEKRGWILECIVLKNWDELKEVEELKQRLNVVEKVLIREVDKNSTGGPHE